MSIFLWILQIVLALLFAFSGLNKLLKGSDSLDHTKASVIGFIEILGAIGLLLPWALNVLPILTPIAAVGFALIMIFAMLLHNKRGEKQAIGMNAIIFVLAAIVAIGRF